MGKRNEAAAARFNQPAVFMLIADGTINQIVETADVAKREKSDLERAGYEVKVRIFQRATLAEALRAAEAYQAKRNGQVERGA